MDIVEAAVRKAAIYLIISRGASGKNAWIFL